MSATIWTRISTPLGNRASRTSRYSMIRIEKIVCVMQATSFSALGSPIRAFIVREWLWPMAVN